MARSFTQDTITKLKANPIAMVCAVLISLYIIAGFGAYIGLWATDFNKSNFDISYQAPSKDYILGTDVFGRSVLARAIHGTWTALSVGLFASLIAVSIGTFLGLLAGYFGGWTDRIITWLYTTLDSIPYILLLASFAYVLGQGISNVFIALGLTNWVVICRIVRSETLKQKSLDYVKAAQALGVSHRSRMFKHILPNISHLIVIQFALRFVSAVKVEVILSYLGLGVEPGTPSWGMMIDDSKGELVNGIWWNLATASLFLFGLVLAVNLFTDALRKALDPKYVG